jgi:hypothetical protein
MVQESSMVGMMARDGTSNFQSRRGPDAADRGRIVTALALAAVVGAGMWTVFDAKRSEAGRTRGVRLLTLERPFPAEGRYPSDPYVGPRVCAECHPGAYALYARSGHSRTLRSAGSRLLARTLDGTKVPDPVHPSALWGYQYRDGQLHISHTEGGRVEESIAEYAFGSGYHATTFVNVLDPGIPAILQHRLTYYTKEHSLGVTPGHDAQNRLPGGSPLGAMTVARDARKCFGCHITDASARADRAIDEETMIPNVSCERCHGPGKAHVEAARRGAPDADLALPFGPDLFTADGLLTLCGTCHRHPSGSHPGQIRPDNPLLARFQPVGVLQSRCFRESGGAFSCITCHDPHARASSDRASYVAVCLSCHAASGPGPGPSQQPPDLHARTPGEPTATGTPCPVEPRGDCIVCHMPRVDAGQHILFADHWIRARRSDQPSPPAHEPSPMLRLLDTRNPSSTAP